MIYRPKILVMDNDENIISAFGDYLRKKNYSMVGASTAEEGLKKMHQLHFDLLITDVRVDSKFGINFIKQAKEIQHDLPVIAMTSYPDKVSEADLKSYGAVHLFIKPLELSKIDEAIDNCLQADYKKFLKTK